jgi:hypothetical protein
LRVYAAVFTEKNVQQLVSASIAGRDLNGFYFSNEKHEIFAFRANGPAFCLPPDPIWIASGMPYTFYFKLQNMLVEHFALLLR